MRRHRRHEQNPTSPVAIVLDEERETPERPRRPYIAQALSHRPCSGLHRIRRSPRCSIAIRSPSASGAGALRSGGSMGYRMSRAPGRPAITDAQVEAVIVTTLEEQPPNATHWSARSMAAALGMSQSAISRIWRARPEAAPRGELQAVARRRSSTRSVTWPGSISTRAAVVLCVDEDPIQALGPSRRRCRCMPASPPADARLHPSRHDEPLRRSMSLRDACHGDAGLGSSSSPHPHRPQVPVNWRCMVVLDNVSTHRTPAIQRGDPRHFTRPTPSWMNLERWFAGSKRLRAARTTVSTVSDAG